MIRPATVVARNCVLAALVLLVPSAALAGARFQLHTDVDPARVEAAIAKAKEFLYSKVNNDGNWENIPQRKGNSIADVNGAQWGGLTSIATYALLASGESDQNPRLKRAMLWLRGADIQGMYALGLRCQMYPFVRFKDDAWKKAIKRDYDLIVRSMKTQKEARGMFNYHTVNSPAFDGLGGRFDHSVSQYGVLGLWAIAQTNVVEIPNDVWKRMDGPWREHQHDDGSWAYQGAGGKNGGTPAMTAAGIATLFITQDYVNRGVGGECRGNIRDDAIERGLVWMSDNFAKVVGGRAFYTLYGVERIGVASGYKYFGTINWYVDGARFMVDSQRPDGSWGGGGHGGAIPDTAFGILFLVRGRAPVVMNKLMYEIDRSGDKPVLANWNQRPRDLANFTDWFIGACDGRFLNWQIVNLKVDVEELHDAPILYIAGNQALNFTQEETDKLRIFVEQGGIILGNADCASAQFVTSFRKLASTMFPKYEFSTPPDDHPLYVSPMFHRAKWRSNIAKVMTLSNGARLLMVLIPDADVARSWQRGNYLGSESHHQLIANLFNYAIENGSLRNKGETYIVKRDEKVAAKRQIKVARLEYAGNWDPEPAGWRRLANILHNQQQLELAVEPVKLGSGKLDKSFALAHMTGTGRFTLSTAEQVELKKYVADGGTLVVDSCGGGTDFAAAAEAQLAASFGGSFSTLPISHAVFNTGNKIGSVAYREYSRKILGRMSQPQIRGLEQGERVGVFFSREDLSVGLVGQSVGAVNGYQPAGVAEKDGKRVGGAADIMTNIVLYAVEKAPSDAIQEVAPAAPDKAQPKANPQPKNNGKQPAKQPAKKK